VPEHGATAAAAIAVGSVAQLLAGRWQLLRRRHALRPTVDRAWAVAIAAGVMAAAIWPLRERSPALTVPLGAVAYSAALWALGGIDRRTLEALRG
jgi:hypothetical protein